MRKVLIVDDSIQDRQALSGILSGDYEIAEAENGLKALAILESRGEEISLILLDLMMPRLDGYAFLKRLSASAKTAGIPVIVLTAQSGGQEELKSLACGAIGFVTKPWNPMALRHQVANLIQLCENAALSNGSERDELTGLYARESFYRSARALLEENPGTEYDILCSNFENFKLINDMLGTRAGDLLLVQYAALLEKHIGMHGICARLSGDTFAVLLPRVDEYTDAFFQDILHALAQRATGTNLALRFGVYRAVDRNVPLSVMCDRALLAARSIWGYYGKCFAVYDDSLRRRLLTERKITDSMASALANQQFQVFLQPKYNLKNNKIAGAEALVRWLHPEIGFMPPASFIPLFEKNGFIADFDRYVWEKTCATIREWMDAGYPTVPLSVNVSRVDAHNPHLPETILHIVQKYALNPEQIHLEITETSYMESPEKIIEIASRLKELGFIIEMDDFGAGYSSLNMLSELPIDVLKLDMKLIQEAPRHAMGRNVLGFIISLARWMNLPVVAEGVETAEQLSRLKDMGCGFAQGFYLAKPMSISDFENLLKVASIDAPEAEPEPPEPEVPANAAASSGRRTMLIVDDADTQRAKLAKTFRRLYDIREADNCREALEYLRTHPDSVEIVLLDPVMPGMDGFQMLQEMKRLPALAHIPVIITSHADGDSEEKALNMGADDFIARPYNPKVVLRRVENVVASAKIRAQEAGRESRLALYQAAYQDYLTGLLNRRGFDQALEGLQPDDPDTPYAVYMLDLDDLKGINDTYGHAYGDAVLREIGKRLKGALRATDIAARIGGDEFVVVMKNMPSPEAAYEKGKRICKALNHFDENRKCAISCSIGVRIFRGASGVRAAMEEADKALYVAKQDPENRCHMWKD